MTEPSTAPRQRTRFSINSPTEILEAAVPLPIGKRIEATHTIAAGNVTTVTDTRITFRKGAGVVVEAGGDFKFTGTATSNLHVEGDVGTFELRGKLTVERANHGVTTIMELHFEQMGVGSETKIVTGKLSFRGSDSAGVVARINEGKFIIRGGAEVHNALDAIVVFVPGSYLSTEQTSENRATITSAVVMNGNLNLDGGDCGNLRNQGNLTFGGTYQATVDFNNMKCDKLFIVGDLALDGSIAVIRNGDFQRKMTFNIIKVLGDRAGQFAQIDAGGDEVTVKYHPVGDVDINS